MIMSIAHGANDVSNAIGPFTTEYLTWKTGVANEETGTPTWIKAVGGLGIGFGFWTFGYVSPAPFKYLYKDTDNPVAST